MTKCRKIGEGVFGEVYLNDRYVLKIIPIEGDVEINGAQQKRFDEILQEVIISQELSALRYGEKNRTAGFVEVLNVRLVEGRYPGHLLDLWDDYDTRQVSENDRPDVFGDNQLYVVFELANCGNDLEAHEFKNAEQSYSAFIQVRVFFLNNFSFTKICVQCFCTFVSWHQLSIGDYNFRFLRRMSVSLVHNRYKFMTRFTLIHCIGRCPYNLVYVLWHTLFSCCIAWT